MFISAKPIFLRGREREVNLTVGFRAVFTAENGQKVIFRAAASAIYRLFINGKLAAHGPARAAHDYFRVDELDVTKYIQNGINIAAVEVAGYNCNSFYLLDQPSFLQAELISGGNIIAATGVNGFEAAVLPERLQKVQRYSYQRTFVESYDFGAKSCEWRTNPNADFAAEEIEIQPDKKLLERNIPPYEFKDYAYERLAVAGTAEKLPEPRFSYRPRFLAVKENALSGFAVDEMDFCLTDEILTHTFNKTSDAPDAGVLAEMKANTYVTADFGINKTGFVAFRLSCAEKITVYLTFDEILMNGDVDALRLGTCNAISCTFEPGEYDFISMEPYTMRYLKFTTFGDCSVSELRMIPLECSEKITAEYSSEDDALEKIFAAAVETFKQNATDIYMDCPSRERAGWLCDSFFTSRVERRLTGCSEIEHNFLENYMLAPHIEPLPEGMLPMCYPSDVLCGEFLPNWTMWMILELKEYLNRTGDRELIDKFKDKVYALIRYFNSFSNDIGLLEKLQGWIFVEWSKAAEFVQDISFPINMLYAQTLKAAAELYKDESFKLQAENILQRTRELSYKKDPASGEYFFADHAVRKDGELVVLDDFTEVCQYYAFFFGAASPETHPELWKRLTVEFGPEREGKGLYPSVYQANSFIGNYLRLELLNTNGMHGQVLEEIKGYFNKMQQTTGTLWEHSNTGASCCHGFASYVACWLLSK